MTPPKTLLQLVQTRAFRVARHRDLIFTDTSIDELLNAVDRGEVEIPLAEHCQLSWCAHYGEGWYRGLLWEPMAVRLFMAAMRGDHPSHPAEPDGWDI